jgi:hypothetical protein
MELSGRPGMNEVELTRLAVDSINPEAAKKVLMSDQEISQQQPPPDPRMIEVQGRIAAESLRLRFEADKHEMEMEKLKAEVEKTRAEAILAIAKAEAAELGPQVEQYREQLRHMSVEMKARMDLEKEKFKAQAGQEGGDAGSEPEPGGVPGMAAEPANPGDIEGAPGSPGGLAPPIG